MNLEKRNIALSIFLCFVTFGIFPIIWTVYMGRDAASVKDRNDSGTTEILLMIFLPFVGFYLAGKKLHEGCVAKGIPHSDNSITYLLLGLFGLTIVNYGLLQSDLNKLADYGNNPYGGNPYGGNAYGGNPYGGNAYGGNTYGGNPYGGNQYYPPNNPNNQPRF